MAKSKPAVRNGIISRATRRGASFSSISPHLKARDVLSLHHRHVFDETCGASMDHIIASRRISGQLLVPTPEVRKCEQICAGFVTHPLWALSLSLIRESIA
eukprot:scaffold42684_cov281-Isochrysis_galbana.AAC.1